MTNKSHHHKAVSPAKMYNDLKLRYPYQIEFDTIIQSANETRVNIARFYFYVWMKVDVFLISLQIMFVRE